MAKRFVKSVLIASATCSLLVVLLGMTKLQEFPTHILYTLSTLAGVASLFSIPPALFGGLVYWIYKRKYGPVIMAWVPSLISSVIVVIPPLALLFVAFSSSSTGNSDGIGVVIGEMSIAAPCGAVIAATFGAGVGQR